MTKHGLTLRNKKERNLIDALLIYTLCNEFSNDFNVQSDFCKIFGKKKIYSFLTFLSYDALAARAF